jgi:hypothetical protein
METPVPRFPRVSSPQPRLAVIAVIVVIAGGPLALTQAQTIVQGPVVYPATGSRFYVVQAADWNQARAFARARGGDLATVNDAAENEWIRANLTVNNTRKLFIGLNDAETEGSFRWSDGSTSAYRNWDSGGSFNTNNNDYALMSGPTGTWQLTNATFSQFAVVEISGPLKVPQEFQTIDAALEYADDLPSAVVDISSGTYTLTTALNLSGQVTVRGVGPVAPTIRSAAGIPFFAIFGQWTFDNIAFVDRSRTYGSITLNSSAGTMTFRDCTFSSEFGRASLPILSAFIGSVRAERCTFTTVSAAAAPLSGNAGNFVMINCVFNDLTTVTTPGTGTDFFAINCTFHRVGDLTQVFAPGWSTTVTNSVFSNVSGQVNRNGVSINYSLVPFEIPLTTGNIMGAPLYVNAAAGDFRLRPGTAGVDKGSINALFAARPSNAADASGAMRFVDDPTAVDGPVAGVPWALDMGALETQSTSCPADFNNDGVADFFDYLDFVAAFDSGC